MSSTEVQVLVWFAVVMLVTLNGFSAGVAAGLYAWAPRMPRAGRILTAAVAAGLPPSSVLFLAAIDPVEFDLGEGAAGLVIFGFLFGTGAIGSLPGSWLVTRALDKPGDHFRTFE